MDRQCSINAFLKSTGWADAARISVAGDASHRRYDRLIKANGNTAILMDAPPEKGENIRPFVRIATYLRSIQLNAPEILAMEPEQGFLILEDLGDDLFSRVLARSPRQEHRLYSTAIDVLTHLHRCPSPPLSPYDSTTMANFSALAYDWYLSGATGAETSRKKAGFIPEFHALLQSLSDDKQVLIQRDYHAENLLWMPQRDGVQRVGLLDFQDAMSGHPAYDLVSILQDARRDVSPDVQTAMKQRYITQNNQETQAFARAYAILGLQRNLRILGGFSRLCMRNGKSHYVDLIPRVWGHIKTNLGHPALNGIAQIILEDLPAPTPQILNGLKSKCATVPHL